jgi:TRAP-type uncharacterized transport system fused permease subunit
VSNVVPLLAGHVRPVAAGGATAFVVLAGGGTNTVVVATADELGACVMVTVMVEIPEAVLVEEEALEEGEPLIVTAVAGVVKVKVTTVELVTDTIELEVVVVVVIAGTTVVLVLAELMMVMVVRLVEVDGPREVETGLVTTPLEDGGGATTLVNVTTTVSLTIVVYGMVSKSSSLARRRKRNRRGRTNE